MTLSRRRFLTISAAFALTPVGAQAQTWQGRAFGADVSLSIRGPRHLAQPALEKALSILRETEALFSLYDPKSALSRLNRTGHLETPDPVFLRLMQAADQAHMASAGLFDPTVQPVWVALSEGRDPAAALTQVGWNRVRSDSDRVTLGPGQSLTFNGIAQGFATDRMADMLAAEGLTDTLVNIGEYRAAGGPWRLGLQDPDHGHMGMRTLSDGAIATSGAYATRLAGGGHIVHPLAAAKWSTVSVEAPTATVADSLSTAMVLAPRAQIEEMRERSGITRITLVSFDGDLVTL